MKKCGGHLLERESYISENPSEVIFEALHHCFPKTTKMWCMLGCEFPLDALLGIEVGDRVLCLLLAVKLMDIDQFSSSAHEIGSVVTPDHGRLTSSSDKPSYGR